MYKQYTEVPDVLEGVLDKETFEKARLYQLDKSDFGFWYGLFSQVESTVSFSPAASRLLNLNTQLTPF